MAHPAISVAAIVVDFDELSAYSDANNSYYDGYGEGAVAGSWSSQGVTFNTNQYGPGWSYSRVQDATTPGHQNQWAAFPGSGFGGTGNYAVGTTFSPNGVFFNLPSQRAVESLRISNATYPALSMRDGDAFAEPFGGESGNEPDFFRVTFTGFSGLDTGGAETGSSTFLLADYRFVDNTRDYIVDDWQLLDLSTLGNARSVGVTLESSDVGQWGMNTPAYFAIDNLSLAVTAVPEPGSMVVLSSLTAGGLAASRWRKRRKAKVTVQ